MRFVFLKWILVLAFANIFVFFAVQWLNSAVVGPYQLRRISEEAHSIVSAEIPHFDLLLSANWEEAARTLHERHGIPGKLGSAEQNDFSSNLSRNSFDSRVRYEFDFPKGAFAHILLKDKFTVLEIGPLPGMYIVSLLPSIVGGFIWLLANGVAVAMLHYSWLKRTLAVEKATSGFLTDGSARLIHDDTQDSLGVAARSINLMAMRAEQLLRQRQQMIHEQRELFHAVAHECRAPLARLSFALEMLEHADSSKTRTQLTRDMENAIAELDGLVRELLTYARLQHGSQKLEIAECEIAVIAQDIVSKTKTLFPSIRFTTEGHSDGKVWVDQRLFARCITNLVRNASAFASTEVSVTWSLQDQTFTLHVDDDGPGVPFDQRERVFEPFIRLDPSRSRDSGGTGLGLAIVKGISERHSGSVYVENSIFGGARFTLCWPIKH